MVYEVVIIGSGPAGLTAGIYLGRFKRTLLIIDGNQPGGQLMSTGAVENWPGNISINGPELMKNMREHAKACGAAFLADTVVCVEFSSSLFTVFTKHDKILKAKSVIIATGSSPRRLDVPGEDEYWGKGVTVCATCDAPLYKDKQVVVVGGGNSAIAESYALSKFAKHVIILQLYDRLTATDPLTDKGLECPNVEGLYNNKVVEVKGDGVRVTAVVLEDQKDRSISEITTEGIFIAIGMVPNSAPFKDSIEIDDSGYIVKKHGCCTSQPGIFVAGDVADRVYQQAITASGMGCSAALECEEFFNR